MRAAAGADLALLKSGERFLVHCRDWRKREIGLLAIQELDRALKAVGAQGGYVLTAGIFTREAREFARATRIELLGGGRLIDWLRGAKRGVRGASGEPAPRRSRQLRTRGSF
jgi:restriction system protein